MRIYQMGPAMAPPKLSNIGIRVQTIPAGQSDAPSTPATEPSAESDMPVDRLERHTLSRLSSQPFAQVVAFADSSPNQALILPSGELNATRLLNALSEVGDRLDLATAMDLHQAASELVASIRQQNGLSAETPVKLVVSGAFGQIELDLARLDPQALQMTFDKGLASQPKADLQDVHRQISGLSQRVRAGFDTSAGDRALAGWVSALRMPAFQPESFFQQTLGFNPLNGESSVKHLLQGLPQAAGPAPKATALSGLAPPEATKGNHRSHVQHVRQTQSALVPRTGKEQDVIQESVAEGQELAEKSEELIEIANQLELQLQLSPSTEAPDILTLLRSFQTTIRQLDKDVSKILRKQNQNKQFENKLLAQFAERLQGNLRFNKERLDTLDGSGSERLRLLVDLSLVQLRAKVWLAGEGGSSQAVQAALATLQHR